MSEKTKRFCPDAGLMTRALMEELSPREKEGLLSHVSRCPSCRSKYEALIQLQADLRAREKALEEIKLSRDEERELRRMARQRLQELSRKPLSFFARPFAVGAALVTVLFFILSGYYLLIKGPSSDQTMRGTQATEVRLLKPGEKLIKAPSFFLWTEVKDRDSFLFELIDDELNTLCSEKLFTTQTHLPERVQQRLVRGRVYLWTITARDESGNKLASASKTFEIK